MQEWSVIESECQTAGAEGFPVYGVAVRLSDGGTWSWADVDTDRSAVQWLAERLQRAQPEPCLFEDLVLDFIEEMAGKVQKIP